MRGDWDETQQTVLLAIARFDVPPYLYGSSLLAKREAVAAKLFSIVANDFALDEDQQTKLRDSMSYSNIELRSLARINMAVGNLGQRFGQDRAAIIRTVWLKSDGEPLTSASFLDMMLDRRIPDVMLALQSIQPVFDPEEIQRITSVSQARPRNIRRRASVFQRSR
jgi:hypothetical protein